MQVHVDAVEAHVAGPDNAHNRVEVGAVVVAQAAGLMDDVGDLEDVLVEDTDGVGVGQHQTGGVGADGRPQGVQVDAAVGAGGDVDDGEASHDGGGGVGAVGGVRDDDLRPGGVAAVLVVGLDEHQAGELTVGAGGGLHGHALHTRDLAQQRVDRVDRLQAALDGLDGLQRMDLGEAGQRGHGLVDLGVVLHRAGAEGIEAIVDTVHALGQGGIMTDQVILADMGKVQLALALLGEFHDGNVTFRQQGQVLFFRAALKDQFQLFGHLRTPPSGLQPLHRASSWSAAR